MFRKADELIFDKLIEEIQDIDVKNYISFLHDFVKIEWFWSVKILVTF